MQYDGMGRPSAVIVSRLAHVALGCPDLEAAVRFYGELFGMTQLEAPGDAVYLACGTSNTFELRLRDGDAEMDHFAFSVRSAEALELATERLAEAGALTISALDLGDEPGLAAGVEAVLPSGHLFRLVLESDPRAYNVAGHVAAEHHRGVGPVALEHITLLCDDIAATATFLVDVLGLRISDSVQPPGEPWRNTHLRAGVLHHDLGLLPGDDPVLHHFCFAVGSPGLLVATADALAARRMPLDCSIGRHVAGNNIFVYFKDPNGHRLEVNTDMARVDAAAPSKIVTEGLPFDSWRPGRPPALAGGTPARRHRTGAVA
jgi:catechol 2,3-dioxygenase-like lactoylglutathione lyase family enzyme